MTAAELCREIERRRTAALEARTDAYPRNNPIASDLGPCTREMVLAMTRWKDRPLFGPDLKARFERGNLIESAVLLELQVLGFTVRTERRPFEVKGRDGRLILRGKIDGFISDGRAEFPVEIKSLDPNVYRRVNTVEDFARSGWMAKYPKQLCSYLYAESLPEGFFLLDDCLGHWKMIPVPLDYELAESILRQCESAVEHRDAGTLPDYYPDIATCRRCWAFGRVCDPPGAGLGMQTLDDAELEARLVRREELEPAYREYESLDKAVKETVRGKDGVVVGDWLIRGKEITTQYKALPARVGTQWRTTIERFTKPSTDAAV